jgi:arylsulfatase A-like enzyme
VAGAIKNILFIMCDQLRHDYLGCGGHPHLPTPNIDALAARGVQFSRAYVQSPVCGASRMSFYTGRYVDSHGASWNGIPLKVGEMTMGDYLRPLGMDAVLVGKTHMRADTEGMQRLGIDPDSIIGVRVSECGFDPFDRDDGMVAVGPDGEYEAYRPPYEKYLRDKGYDGPNPWHDWANSVDLGGNRIGSGYVMRNARKPARVANEDSETPYMTSRAMEYIDSAGENPWCVHLSFIKPHWPYVAPAPYNDMFGTEHLIPPCRAESERENPHPVYREFMKHRPAQAFSRDEVREEVVPVYMGLIKQIDDEMGRLFAFLEERKLMDNTLIVFTSDHGDYLGDHWMGEKDLFHDCSSRVPLIICDPSPQADATRGTVCDELVESIDLAPTFLQAAGGDPASQSHRLEGRSLMPLLHGEAVGWRKFAIAEYDYSISPSAVALKAEPKDARLFMVANKQWKYVAAIGYRPMLFDLQNDPGELNDLGDHPEYEAVRAEMDSALRRWQFRLSQRTTRSEDQVKNMRGRSLRRGVVLGVWDETDVPADLWKGYFPDGDA